MDLEALVEESAHESGQVVGRAPDAQVPAAAAVARPAAHLVSEIAVSPAVLLPPAAFEPALDLLEQRLAGQVRCRDLAGAQVHGRPAGRGLPRFYRQLAIDAQDGDPVARRPQARLGAVQIDVVLAGLQVKLPVAP